jgi:hypothetical protein
MRLRQPPLARKRVVRAPVGALSSERRRIPGGRTTLIVRGCGRSIRCETEYGQWRSPSDAVAIVQATSELRVHENELRADLGRIENCLVVV